MHFGGHSFSQIWQATQRSPAIASLPSYTRNGKSRVFSIGAIRSSGYCTVVIRSFETKLPAKFFAVSASPFSIPSPNIASPSQLPQAGRSSIDLAQHNIHAAKDKHHVGHILPKAHIFENREIDQRWRPHTI